MRIDIMTLFPDAVDAMMNASIIGRAQERGFVTIRTHQIREFTTNRQMQVDDYPYGGGRGAVMQADPLYSCWQHICDEAGGRVHTIYMSPCGRVLTQQVARELKERYDHLILVCGHYEGVDQRFLDECVDEEISMGDFVVTGGEIPEEYRRGDAARGGRQPAGERAEKALLRHGLFHALGKRAAEARERDARAGARPLDERSVHAHGVQHDAEHDIARQNARRGELRAVNEHLSERAQRPADEKCLEIICPHSPYPRSTSSTTA